MKGTYRERERERERGRERETERERERVLGEHYYKIGIFQYEEVPLQSPVST